MEGNDCYKFSTIRNYLQRLQVRPILNVIEIGVNVGDVTLLISDYFPEARIIGIEPVQEYFRYAVGRTAHLSRVTLLNMAATYRHIHSEKDGTAMQFETEPLRICRALPSSGCGWEGGSIVAPASEVGNVLAEKPGCFELEGGAVSGITLEEIAELGRFDMIDLIKSDCEGCELSVFGNATSELLRKCRFIVGEYHGLAKFYHTVCERLLVTHKVSLIGDSNLGAFFAELRQGDSDGILLNDDPEMHQLRPWLCDFPIHWNTFNPEYVSEGERYFHAL